MPSLKAIRKRISSVKSTQKITRAMKMVAGAKLNKAQQRITELRPYAVKVQEVLWQITRDAVAASAAEAPAAAGTGAEGEAGALTGREGAAHPLLVARPERRVLLLVLTSDRGLCGAFNTNINKRAEREWKSRTEAGQEVQLAIIGRKGRDYFNRRNAPILEYLPGVWDKLSLETAQAVGAKILAPFDKNEIDAIYLVYNEFKSAITQTVVVERLLPAGGAAQEQADEAAHASPGAAAEFLYEPDKGALLERLVPMYVDISILRALYESMASELGAKLTAMDAANKNAKEMIDTLTLEYNKARQAAITKELMEIIGGSEALKE
ncbi:MULTISPECIES: ATP synthase F1 subunit gamma [Sorangium]|uniref:ATP synthase gamma chain n=1 Tax=Sorangium cellulosum TaxID=56 RepID=A0A4P2R6W3_SORCE|nr:MULTISPECIES: ATP synthase F1 subunit gamma [Sorangium]AUX38616.1 F0F1 ATP synthase subunit gamma [Sorangium cellulosum]WCQ97901.1 ATP synthase gamma chain [Sorangium sp. Soce836]